MTFRVSDLMLEPVVAAGKKKSASPKPCKPHTHCHNHTAHKPPCTGCTRKTSGPSTCTNSTGEGQKCDPASCQDMATRKHAQLYEAMRAKIGERQFAP
jgi:hypothetical protein